MDKLDRMTRMDDWDLEKVQWAADDLAHKVSCVLAHTSTVEAERDELADMLDRVLARWSEALVIVAGQDRLLPTSLSDYPAARALLERVRKGQKND